MIVNEYFEFNAFNSLLHSDSNLSNNLLQYEKWNIILKQVKYNFELLTKIWLKISIDKQKLHLVINASIKGFHKDFILMKNQIMFLRIASATVEDAHESFVLTFWHHALRTLLITFELVKNH